MATIYPISIAGITDEFSPDIEIATRSMAELGMKGAELRMVFGKNIMDLSDDELDRAIEIVRGRGLEIMSIASPLLKCVLPNAPEVDARFQQDVFASKHTFEDQPRLAKRAFEVAERTGAKIVRVFSYWRTVRPEECFVAIVVALRGLAEQAAERGVIIGLENEHACNVGTGAEAAKVLAAVDHGNLKVVWDPANALVAGENPFPEGYSLISDRIGHVHAKDCFVTDHKPTFGPVGECAVDWKGQISALVRDGYRGWISLETHWPGPGGDKHEASMICGRNLKQLVDKWGGMIERKPRRVGLKGNHMTFPRELRAAIPDLPTCVGRVLELAAIDVTLARGRRAPHVDLRLEVRETGKLDGVFAVRMDLDRDAALALADALRDAVAESKGE